MKLYELTDKYRIFNEYAEDILDGDTSEEDIQMLLDNLGSIEDLIENKVESIAKLLKNIEVDIKSYKDEEERLTKRRKAIQNRYDNIKSYTQSCWR